MATHTPVPSSPPPLSVDDVIQLIEHWSLADRARVLEAVSRSVREDVTPADRPVQQGDATDEDDAEWQIVRERILADVPMDSPLRRMLGAFRKPGVRVPTTREEERELITEAIVEKHLR